MSSRPVQNNKQAQFQFRKYSVFEFSIQEKAILLTNFFHFHQRLKTACFNMIVVIYLKNRC